MEVDQRRLPNSLAVTTPLPTISFRMSIPLRQLHSTLIAALLVATLFSAPMMGLFLPFIILPQVLCIPFFAWAYFKQPERRKIHAMQGVIWLLVVPLTIFGSHFVQHKMARAHADRIISSINKFISTNGRCPRLEELRLSKEELRERLLMSGYSCSDNALRPTFYYSVGFAPFAMYNYDFDKREWYIND